MQLSIFEGNLIVEKSSGNLRAKTILPKICLLVHVHFLSYITENSIIAHSKLHVLYIQQKLTFKEEKKQKKNSCYFWYQSNFSPQKQVLSHGPAVNFRF